MVQRRPEYCRDRSTFDTIHSLIGAGSKDSAALCAPDRSALTFAGLSEQIARTTTRLNRLGIGRNDTVAIVLPNGPELAAAFLGIAAGATAAPLNPSYSEADFAYYLSDTGATALLVQADSTSRAVAVARSLQIPVLELVWSTENPAGTYSISGDAVGPSKDDGYAEADDTALVLHTSGTTSRPKMVHLSQRNVTASAAHIADTLMLSAADRCLNIMPLFHIHGLMAGVLASLAAGGSVLCTGSFNPQAFFSWLVDDKATWYTAVPTLHQAVLRHAERNPAALAQSSLRFIRSSSAPLPRAVLSQLEVTFGTPVIEAYGMTEAAHQIASNPLPPGLRKPGTVGVAAGPHVAIMNASHDFCPSGVVGEIVIRGPNVCAGYANNPEANAACFSDGWFHTGDEGSLDDDGYLTITGRLKEIINRGGQKISPREIDDTLMEHADVAAAAAFPFVHPTLGDEIAAVVVPKTGSMLSEEAVVRFLRGRLAGYKVPRRIVFAEDIPKSPTGKIQRHELARVFGLSDTVEAQRASIYTDNRTLTPLEAKLRMLWQEVLRVEKTAIGLDEHFSMLGGDSLQAVELLTLVEKELGYALPQSVMIQCDTVAGMAAYIERDAASDCVVPIQTRGTRPPFFCVHGADGGVLGMLHLARYLGDDQPFYGIQCVGLDGKQSPLTRIEDMATRYIRDIRKHQPRGPYFLGGYSSGGTVAYEMAQQLIAEGEGVALLALIDAFLVPQETLVQRLRRHAANLGRMGFAERVSYVLKRYQNATSMLTQQVRYVTAKWGIQNEQETRTAKSVEAINRMAARAYAKYPCVCNAVLFKGRLPAFDAHMHDGWTSLIRRKLEIRAIPAEHLEVFSEPYVQVLAAELTDCIQQRCAAPFHAAPSAPIVSALNLRT